MNAHADAGAMKSSGGGLAKAVASECEHMVRMFDSQLADLEEVARQLRAKRQQWSEKLEAARAGDAKAALSRAPHGAVKTLVLEELRASQSGMDTKSLFDRIVPTLPMITRRSIRQALARLSENGAVVRKGLHWHSNT